MNSPLQEKAPNKPPKIIVLFGTRPEALKLAPLITALKEQPAFQTLVVSTGQHKELIAQVLDLFHLAIDEDFGVMEPNQTLARLSEKLIPSCATLFERVQPDYLIVQGDTTSAFIASLVASYYKIEILHIEAGLRSFNKYHPFPEENNRKMISAIADWHFAPIAEDADNLLKEGCDPQRIFIVGNPIVDTLCYLLEHTESLAWHELTKNRPSVVITAHRRENFGPRLQGICEAIKQLASDHPTVQFISLLHPNPNTRAPMEAALRNLANVTLSRSLSHVDFIHLLRNCRFVMTDSGGIQEEAAALHKPVLVLRDFTERMAGVRKGIARLIGTETATIIREGSQLLSDPQLYAQMSDALHKDLYGDGHTSARIIDLLKTVILPLRGSSNALLAEKSPVKPIFSGSNLH